MRYLLGVWLISVSAGCFKPEKPNCVFLCGGGQVCPEGYACGSDGRCHLMVGGGLATCDDELPAADGPVEDGAETPDGAPDGTPPPDGVADGPDIDAPAIDAPIDASPIDAPVSDAPPNTPPSMSLTPPTPTYDLTPGDMRTIVAMATDPDTGDVLSYDAIHPGTNRNPFEVRTAGDAAGGVWTVGTRTFTFEAGIVGTFDVRFTVNDGRGGQDFEDVRLNVAAHAVMLNEVQTVPDNIELINTGTSAADVSGWNVCAPPDCFAIPASTTIAAGAFLVIRWNQTGTDSASEKFTGVQPALDTASQVVLFVDDNFTLSRRIRDFVKWQTPPGGRVDQAVFAGQWPGQSSATANPGAGESIARTPGVNTEAPADWVVDPSPSIGSAN